VRIVLIAPLKLDSSPRLDYSYWNFYLPLVELGHAVEFFDITSKGNKELARVVDSFKPDLLFCIMTGAPKTFTPDEPWDVIGEETRKGNVKTFNWYCDDSYRFESFSKSTCSNFHWCSTPEKSFIKKYQDIGYTNVVYSTWHANSKLYSSFKDTSKIRDHIFIGGLHANRVQLLTAIQNRGHAIDVCNQKLSFEDMIYHYSSSKVCLNFTKDASNAQTQMKARIFEILATGSLLLTEHTSDLVNCFDKGTILTFINEQEAADHLTELSKDSQRAKELARKGYSEFLRKHDSKIRLSKLLKDIA
tara:strand:- start:853 stop:1761 length:909 start_codon:yes stop_codon:yes gene_type:complete